MARVIASRVKNIIQTDLTDAQITIHIEAASNLVTARLTGAGLTDEQLSDVEMYLAAHLISIRAIGGMDEYKVGETQFKATPSGASSPQSLQSTSYGRAALALDTSGKLASAGKQRALFSAHGHVPQTGDTTT